MLRTCTKFSNFYVVYGLESKVIFGRRLNTNTRNVVKVSFGKFRCFRTSLLILSFAISKIQIKELRLYLTKRFMLKRKASIDQVDRYN